MQNNLGNSEGISLSGHILFKLFDKFGNLKEVRAIRNSVTDVGKAEVAGLINGATTGAFTYTGIGISTPGTTALGAERDEAGATNTNHKASTCTRVTTDVTNDTAQLVTTFNFTATLAITESGVFDASPTGIMLCAQSFSAINVVSGDSLQMTWKVDVD
jgi:hypothetical protein